MKKALLVIIAAFYCTMSSLAQDLRSDTIDIINISINLEIIDYTNKVIDGHTDLTFSPKMNGIRNFNVDLLALTVDSIILGSSKLSYTHNDTTVMIDLGSTYNSSDTLVVSIYYQGTPEKDASWGGFYFQGNYAYNMGVGFDADPHNYGRVWFPCFDNFVERSTYDFAITTSGGKKAYCNGEYLRTDSLNGDTIVTFWRMPDEIPSYLASVAVADYAEVRWTHQGIQKNIPVVLAARAPDTNNLKGSFIHLDSAIEAFETYYGPYLFNRVGYAITPFNRGAMEHATNINYPRNTINGNTNSETLMAHELAHHWWGDLVTCDEAREMWINEGMASYSEHLFLEFIYGKDVSIDVIKANHLDVIQYAHIKEEKYRPISGLPHQYTYGTHVYDKGASMAHNLRTYMGDSLYFSSVQRFMNEHQFQDVNSALLRDKLTQYSGIDMADFFDDWVFGPGWAEFNVDSFSVTAAGSNFKVDFRIKQKQSGSDHLFNYVPIQVYFHEDHSKSDNVQVTMSGESQIFSAEIDFNPQWISVNDKNELNMGVTSDIQAIDTEMSYELLNAKMRFEVLNITSPAVVHVEHHWAEPDPIKGNLNNRLSPNRYWKVMGDFESSAEISARFDFDARNLTSGGDGNLDNDLLKNGVDSVILMYRENAQDDWWEYQHYEKVTFPSLPYGRMLLSELKTGEYVLANGYSAIGINEIENDNDFVILPNPAKNVVTIRDNSGDSKNKDVQLYRVNGRLVYSTTMASDIEIDVAHFPRGTYIVYIMDGEKVTHSDTLILSR